MKIWCVVLSDCEGIYETILCSTKQIAEEQILKKRDILVQEWKRMDRFVNRNEKEICAKNNIKYKRNNIYLDMVKNLSSNNYKKWDNYPHESLYIYEQDVVNE